MSSNAFLKPRSGSDKANRHKKPYLKVRTGCAICKHRKIKCDEGKPSCNNCIRSGWQCAYQKAEGKSASTKWPLVPKAYASTSTIHHNLLTFPRRSKFQNEQEHQSFQTFCEKTVFTLGGFEEPDVWNQLVLQACENQESIRNTVIALGALDQTLQAAQ